MQSVIFVGQSVEGLDHQVHISCLVSFVDKVLLSMFASRRFGVIST